MTIYLRQSTASQEVLLGPAIDDTDFKTPKTGLTIANTDIKVWKAGATTLANKNSGGATEISGGYYYGVFDATDTDTAGSMRISIKVATALIIFADVCVLPAQVYDSLVLGTDLLDANTSQAGGTAWGSGAITAGSIASDAITAAKVADDVSTEFRTKTLALTTASGVVGSGSTTANVVASSVAVGATTSLSADAFKGRVIIFNSDTTTAALRGQAAVIVSHTSGSTPTFTLATGAWTTAPLTTDTFTVV